MWKLPDALILKMLDLDTWKESAATQMFLCVDRVYFFNSLKAIIRTLRHLQNIVPHELMCTLIGNMGVWFTVCSRPVSWTLADVWLSVIVFAETAEWTGIYWICHPWERLQCSKSAPVCLLNARLKIDASSHLRSVCHRADCSRFSLGFLKFAASWLVFSSGFQDKMFTSESYKNANEHVNEAERGLMSDEASRVIRYVLSFLAHCKQALSNFLKFQVNARSIWFSHGMAQWKLIEFNCADGYSYSLHYGGKMQYKERLLHNEPKLLNCCQNIQ